MGLTFHWFLPTSGDSRGLVAGGHGLPMAGDRPATLRSSTRSPQPRKPMGSKGF